MKIIQHKFVEFVPETIEEGILYISVEYRTAVHNCACGCGNKVVTPISLADWRLTVYGKFVSLYPSIGNWNFPCRSHYWIIKNEIEYAPSWSEKEVKKERKKDKKRKKKYFDWKWLSNDHS
jgi:hypothetical protein